MGYPVQTWTNLVYVHDIPPPWTILKRAFYSSFENYLKKFNQATELGLYLILGLGKFDSVVFIISNLRPSIITNTYFLNIGFHRDKLG